MSNVAKISDHIELPSPNGFVNLWRDINEQEWSKDELLYSVFTKLLTQAQHKAGVWTFKGLKVALQPGEYAYTYNEIVDLFSGIKDKEHARRIVKKFISLGQIYKRDVKNGRVNIGIIIGFSSWKKWQNSTIPQTTHKTTPKVTDIKGCSDCETTPQTTPQTTLNNNVLKDLKKSMPSGEGEQPEKNNYTKEREEAFEHMWSEWRKCKKLVNVKDNSKKKPTKDRFMNSIFPASKVRSLGLDEFMAEVDSLVDLMWTEHEALYRDQQSGGRYFHSVENQHAVNFLKQEGWRD